MKLVRCPGSAYPEVYGTTDRPVTVSSLRKDYSRNLAVSSFSPKVFDDDPLAFLGEARSSKTGADDGHCAFKADSSMGESENLKVRIRHFPGEYLVLT